MAGDRVRALVFGEIAEEYDRVRPGYPPELIADVIAYATADAPVAGDVPVAGNAPVAGSAPVVGSAPVAGSAPAGISALDVGAGTGKATLAFAAHDVRITALEPDPAMALILRQRSAGADIHIAMASLETFEPEEQYDLVYSAQAFHWAAPETRWTNVAAALRPGGALALFWNQDRIADLAVWRQLLTLTQDHVPAAKPDTVAPTPEELLKGWPQTELGERLEFGEFQQQHYKWVRELSRADYLAYLTTQSAYQMLEDEERDELIAQLEAVLPDPVVLEVVTLLYLAKRN